MRLAMFRAKPLITRKCGKGSFFQIAQGQNANVLRALYLNLARELW